MLGLESTTYPGTTSELLGVGLHNLGFSPGENFYLIYSPEREDLGNPNFATSDIPRVCAGLTDTCQKLVVLLYEQIVDRVVSGTETAEMTKLLENNHRAVNVGLVIEMEVVFDRMEIHI